MKKTGTLILLAGSILFFANCHEKAFPVATDKNKSDDKVVNVDNSFTDEQRVQGKTIFESECKKCHDLPNPGDHNLKAWNKILPDMFDKAKMSEDNGMLVRAYVIFHAKES